MPAARRRLRRRRRAPMYRRISRWSQYNTLRTKCEYTTTLTFPNTQNPGQPYFSNTEGGNRNWINFADMMKKYAKNDQLREMFAWVSVTGVKLEALPHSVNVGANVATQTPVTLAILPGVNGQEQNMTYDQLVCVNTSILLDPTQRQSRYWSWRGGQFDMKVAGDSSALTSGQLVVRSMFDGVYASTNGWNIKVTLYLYWRYTKIV